MISILMVVSTASCLFCAIYYFKLAWEKERIGDDIRFVISFGLIAVAYAILKNSIPINISASNNSLILQEFFRILAPLMFAVMAFEQSRLIHKYESYKLNYNGIERRHTN